VTFRAEVNFGAQAALWVAQGPTIIELLKREKLLSMKTPPRVSRITEHIVMLWEFLLTHISFSSA
jgi:hypothetical protein